jgi:hypothetical protein
MEYWCKENTMENWFTERAELVYRESRTGLQREKNWFTETAELVYRESRTGLQREQNWFTERAELVYRESRTGLQREQNWFTDRAEKAQAAWFIHHKTNTDFSGKEIFLQT